MPESATANIDSLEVPLLSPNELQIDGVDTPSNASARNTPQLISQANSTDALPPLVDTEVDRSHQGTWYAAVRFHPIVLSKGRAIKLKPILKRFGALNASGALYVGRGFHSKSSPEEYVLAVSSKARDFNPFFDRCAIMHKTDSRGGSRWQICGSGTVWNAHSGFKLPLDEIEWLKLSTGSQVALVSKVDPFLTFSAEFTFHVDLLELLIIDSEVVQERKCI